LSRESRRSSAETELSASEVEQDFLGAATDRHHAHFAVDALDLVAADV
jgi:hypothetical protein